MDWLGNLANYIEDYNVSLFHVVCTVTVRFFCSRCDAALVYSSGCLLIYISKPFVIFLHSQHYKNYLNRVKENKDIKQRNSSSFLLTSRRY